MVATPGLTALRTRADARRELLDDSLAALEVVRAWPGTIVDVGSGGGAPGLPLAAALPDREVTLLEAERRKADFLTRWTGELPNLRVVRGRAEEQETDAFGVAVAKALAPPPVAAEWCLPLVAPGGAAVLFAGEAAGDLGRVAEALNAAAPEEHAVPGSRSRRLLVFRKLGPTPPGFPRRPGTARKRPLG